MRARLLLFHALFKERAETVFALPCWLCLALYLLVKVNRPRRETEPEQRIWPSDVAAQLEPMPWRVVPRNIALFQMKSLGVLLGSEISGAHESLLCWLWKYCTTAVGSANHVDWAAPGVGCWELTTSCQCRATLEANREGFHSLERVVVLESGST